MKAKPYDWLLASLDCWARYMEARFGHPVYLVGGALKEQQPRDVDLVIIIPDQEFHGRYRQEPEEWRRSPGPRWVRDMGKFSRGLASGHRINVDFKVQPETEGKLHARRPRVRLGAMKVDTSMLVKAAKRVDQP